MLHIRTTVCRGVKHLEDVKPLSIRFNSTTAEKLSCKLLIVGGGSGGCSIAAKFAPKLGKDRVIIVEPADIHYYQPLFTLVGGGVCSVETCAKPMRSVLPKEAKWIKDEASVIEPHESSISTKNGTRIDYEFLVLALGLQLNYDKVDGLLEALEKPGSGVGSNYSPKYVGKTFQELQSFKKGNAVFTCPSTPIKCGGAPQKIAYLAEHYLRNEGKRSDATFLFRTGGGVYFPSPYYEEPLKCVARNRGIDVALKQELVAVNHEKRTARFQDVDSKSENEVQYEFLHVTPPQGPLPVLSRVKDLVDAGGWVDVDKETLQHNKFSNIFSLGDCSSLPTSKTAAAIAAQSAVLSHNLMNEMKGEPNKMKYDGYTSCPLVTGYNSLILAEFDYEKKPLETFPFDQRKESLLMYYMKRYLLPSMYWNLMLRGKWNGPCSIRRIMKSS